MQCFGAQIKIQVNAGNLRKTQAKTQENSGKLRKSQENSGKPIQRTNAICKPSKTECETVEMFL